MSTEGAATSSDSAKGNNNARRRNRNNQSGGRGGKSRGRGKGRGRGRGGRGKGAQDPTPSESTDEKATVDTLKSTDGEKSPQNGDRRSTDEISSQFRNSWFFSALENLGHFESSSVGLAMEVEDDPKTADSQLVSLTLWLEDRLIRSWCVHVLAMYQSICW